ncbi:uncharacterized protein LOC130998683 [Salvia miltiorrhiza]|uniref:uncharacterized protein LOC130998683 n=1 Tax=Salvia miltiorrhiza TaxID=226208 RepID=UPI0025AD057D|nr:uncharacterized protein LOC130998683 [Salvia miltiorrhiza]
MSTVIAQCDSFEHALTLILRDQDIERKANVCMTLWQIWRDRNAMIWQHTVPVPSRSVLCAAAARTDWKLAQTLPLQKATAPASVVCVGWHSMPQGSIKCNVDAAFFAEDQSMGIGIAIRNHEGDFVIGKSIKLPGRRSVVEGELLGIKEALSWIKELSYGRGCLESDSKRVCDLINSGERNRLELGVIVSICKQDLLELSDFTICFVGRNRNGIAHCLAKAARDIFTHHVWNEPPSSVVGHLHVPCSCVQ